MHKYFCHPRQRSGIRKLGRLIKRDIMKLITNQGDPDSYNYCFGFILQVMAKKYVNLWDQIFQNDIFVNNKELPPTF